jgi:hypothetical protein
VSSNLFLRVVSNLPRRVWRPKGVLGQGLVTASVKWALIDGGGEAESTVDFIQQVCDLAVPLSVLRMESLTLPEAQAVLSVLALQVLVNSDEYAVVTILSDSCHDHCSFISAGTRWKRPPHPHGVDFFPNSTSSPSRLPHVSQSAWG